MTQPIRRTIEVTYQEAAILEEALYQYMKNNCVNWSEDDMVEWSVLKGYVSFITNKLHADEAAAEDAKIRAIMGDDRKSA